MKLIEQAKEKAVNALEHCSTKKGLFASGRLMVALIDKGLSRSWAYDLVQKPALKSYREKLDFKTVVLKNKEITKLLAKKDMDRVFDINSYLQHVDRVFKRFGF